MKSGNKKRTNRSKNIGRTFILQVWGNKYIVFTGFWKRLLITSIYCISKGIPPMARVVEKPYLDLQPTHSQSHNMRNTLTAHISPTEGM